MKMEERNRSRSHNSGGVVKNRSSSGCLIIKKNPNGVGGMGSSGGRKLQESKKTKKRPRFMSSDDSSSSDEELLELHRRRVVSGTNQVSSSSLVYQKGIVNKRGFSSTDDFEDILDRNNKLMRVKRRELDVYDFDEYDDLNDDEGLGTRHFHDSENRLLSTRPGKKSGNELEFESGSSKGDIIYKRRRNSFGGGGSSEKIRYGDHHSVKRRFEMKSERPLSIEREKFRGSDEAIRLQGKNGVLKVMVKHKKETNEPLKPQKYPQREVNNRVLGSQEMTPKNTVIGRSPYSEKQPQKKPVAIGKIDKDQPKKRKSLSVKSSEESDEESEDSDTSPKLHSRSVEVHRSVKRGRSGGSTQSPERAQPTKLKEGKVKRGSGTEKQLLREKIRNMLVSAGWTIDYRPRRGRDYFDAVYVSPSGTAYWSIIKAYDAFQKQLEEEGNNFKAGHEGSSFAPISDDILSKLTRQTQKKIEKELRRKKREEGGGKRKKGPTKATFKEDESDTDSKGSGRHDEKLSSFIKRHGKSLKNAGKERGEKSSSMYNSRFIHGRKSKKIGRCTLLIRSSKKGRGSESDGFIPYRGKRNILSWLIDAGTVKLSEKVQYMNSKRTRVMLEGWITRDGIHCGCCSKILTVSKFEIHAASKLRQPFQNICLSSGASLLQCQVDAWNRQDESLRNGFNKIDVDGDDPDDDTCAMCGDGGNLICCDGCPSTFHQNCLDIRMLPPGNWHCPHCSCKFCGLADVNMAEGSETKDDTLLTCSLCERKYHSSCMEDMDGTLVNSNGPVSYCGSRCQELFERLQKLLGVKHELEAGLCWSLIHRTDLNSETSLRGFPQRVEWNSKLAVALAIMNECFLPIIDRRSGINMIHNVIYNCGSNFTRLNYSGFYTVILERGDEIISAASIRIHGTQLAEMPFIGTRDIYRRQGMCRRLFSAIESALRSLKVEKLIIPAISELMETWTKVFGFSPLRESDKKEMRTVNMLAFTGTDMLQKKLLDLDRAKTDFAGDNSLDVGHSPSVVPDVTKKSDLDVSPEPGTVLDSKDDEFSSQDKVVPVDETSTCHVSTVVCNELEPSLDTACPVVSNEVKPQVSSEGTQETAVNESAGDVKAHISPDVSADIHEPGKSFNDSLAKCDMEASDDYKLTREAIKGDSDIYELGKSIKFSPSKLDVEASAGCKLTQEVIKGEVDLGSLPEDVSLASTSDSALSKGILENDNHTPSDDGKHHSLSEESREDVVMEKPVIPSQADEGDIRHCLENDGDVLHEPKIAVSENEMESSRITEHSTPIDDVTCAKNDGDVLHEPKIVVSENEMECSRTTEQSTPIDDVAAGEDKRQPDSFDGCSNHAIVQAVGNHSCELSSHNVEESPHTNENPPSLSTDSDGGTKETVLLPVPSLDDSNTL